MRKQTGKWTKKLDGKVDGKVDKKLDDILDDKLALYFPQCLQGHSVILLCCYSQSHPVPRNDSQVLERNHRTYLAIVKWPPQLQVHHLLSTFEVQGLVIGVSYAACYLNTLRFN